MTESVLSLERQPTRPFGFPDHWMTMLLSGGLALTPAISIQAAGWSEHLEPVPWLAAVGSVAGYVLSRCCRRSIFSHLIAIAGGLALATAQYAWFLPHNSPIEQWSSFLGRLATWVTAAFAGAVGADNLLFAYSMGLLAWSVGYLAMWTSFRSLHPWWAIVSTGVVLLLNLSYASPALLPFVYLHIVVSLMLLVHLSTVSRRARWHRDTVEPGFHPRIELLITTAVLAPALLLFAWRLPAGQVNHRVAAAWEQVAGPWQGAQSTFARLFPALYIANGSGSGLTAAQTLAPREAFELGTAPVLRVSGQEPAYWRAITYDRYTGKAMTTSGATAVALDRGQRLPIGSSERGRAFLEYSVTLLAPSSAVLYAPDTPVSIGRPTTYEYRTAPRDFGLLRPSQSLSAGEGYRVLASISRASKAELRQAGTIYPAWIRSYLELPSELPEVVRNESWRVVDDAMNAYDAASRLEAYLRELTYSTQVPLPPVDRDWVSFLLFESRTGYCDYYATAMAVMLRAVGIPARVASGYVTGEWDSSSQTYMVTEAQAHSWTEVYFPEYGWITFEPSANRALPTRAESSPAPLADDEFTRALEREEFLEEFLDENELHPGGSLIPSAPRQTIPLVPAGVLILMGGAVVLALGIGVTGLRWSRGSRYLPPFARPYRQIIRLATWCGAGPSRAQTPFEYASQLARDFPSAANPVAMVTEAYVAGTYGAKHFNHDMVMQVQAAGTEVQHKVLIALIRGRWQPPLVRRLCQLLIPNRRDLKTDGV